MKNAYPAEALIPLSGQIHLSSQNQSRPEVASEKLLRRFGQHRIVGRDLHSLDHVFIAELICNPECGDKRFALRGQRAAHQYAETTPSPHHAEERRACCCGRDCLLRGALARPDDPGLHDEDRTIREIGGLYVESDLRCITTVLLLRQMPPALLMPWHKPQGARARSWKGNVIAAV